MSFKWPHPYDLIENMRNSYRVALPLLLVSFSSIGAPSALKPFLSNGCTGFPDGTKENPMQWRHCCVLHDLAFWAGGCSQFREQADLELKRCVADTGSKFTAFLMYLGVRIGAHSPIKIKGEQWGNGWMDGRSSDQALTHADLSRVSEILLSGLPSDLQSEDALRFVSRLEQEVQQAPHCESSEKN
jgi:hypothetical protein